MKEKIGIWNIESVKDSISYGGKVVNCTCSVCNIGMEFLLQDAKELLDINCFFCNSVENKRKIAYEKGNMGLDKRLYAIYHKLESENQLGEDLNTYIKFKSFAMENGYKPWYYFKKKDESKPYTSDNTLILCSKSEAIEVGFTDIRESASSCCLLENKIMGLSNTVNNIIKLLNAFEYSEYVDSSVVNDISDTMYKINLLKGELNKNVKKLNVSFVGKEESCYSCVKIGG
jgi:hypothetical protein